MDDLNGYYPLSFNGILVGGLGVIIAILGVIIWGFFLVGGDFFSTSWCRWFILFIIIYLLAVDYVVMGQCLERQWFIETLTME